MDSIIDFHTHAFPDALAARAVPALANEGNTRAYLSGRIDDLLASMNRAGITSSILCSIATRPEQFRAILDWSIGLRSSRLIPLASVHPQDKKSASHLKEVSEQGFIGIKMHPYYQDFFIDDRALDPIYSTLSELGLLLVMHTGFDIAFPRIRRSDPEKIRTLLDRFPDLRLITTHLGAWGDWDEVQRLLIGRPLFMEISFALDYLDRQTARKILLAHPEEYLLFGTDSPWEDQTAAVEKLQKLQLGERLENLILRENGAHLLADSSSLHQG